MNIECLLEFEGRIRPVVVDEVEGKVRSEERVDVKAALLALETGAFLEELGRGRP